MLKYDVSHLNNHEKVVKIFTLISEYKVMMLQILGVYYYYVLKRAIPVFCMLLLFISMILFLRVKFETLSIIEYLYVY